MRGWKYLCSSFTHMDIWPRYRLKYWIGKCTVPVGYTNNSRTRAKPRPLASLQIIISIHFDVVVAKYKSGIKRIWLLLTLNKKDLTRSVKPYNPISVYWCSCNFKQNKIVKWSPEDQLFSHVNWCTRIIKPVCWR